MTNPVLEISELKVRYGRFTALEAFSGEFRGGALGLLGPNGAGKSTLLRAILGLVKPSSGRIKVLGHDARKTGTGLRRRIGYMPERDSYLAGVSGVSALTHLGEICGLHRGDAMLRAHDVLHFAGLGEERYREVSTYSVGMRQRYKLAAALVHDPDVLILDEPTNGLDPQGRIIMLDLVRRVCHEHGIHLIMASHLLPDVERICKEVWVMESGTLRMSDTISHLTTAARGAQRVQVAQDHRDGFASYARERGLEVTLEAGDGQLVLSRADAVVDPELVFQIGRECGIPVRGVRTAARSLEDAFLEALQGQE